MIRNATRRCATVCTAGAGAFRLTLAARGRTKRPPRACAANSGSRSVQAVVLLRRLGCTLPDPSRLAYAMPRRGRTACARQDRIHHLGRHRLGDDGARVSARTECSPDDRSHEGFVKRFTRKPATVKERADKGRDHVGRIGACRYVAIAHRSRDHRLKRRRVPHLNPAVNVIEFRITLGGIDNRRHDRRPSCGGQERGKASQESRHITFETAGIGDLLFCA